MTPASVVAATAASAAKTAFIVWISPSSGNYFAPDQLISFTSHSLVPQNLELLGTT